MAKIIELDQIGLKKIQQEIISYCKKPRTTSQVCFQLDKSYNWIWQHMGRLASKGYLKKIETPSGKIRYKTNLEKIKNEIESWRNNKTK